MMFVERCIQIVKRVAARGDKSRRAAFIGARSSRSGPSPLDASGSGYDVTPPFGSFESASGGTSVRDGTPIGPAWTRPSRASGKKIKLIYVISTFRKCGPIFRLIYMLKHINYDKFDVSVVTLSPENSRDTLVDRIEPFPVRIYSLNLGRISGQLGLKKRLKCSIDFIQPDLIHSFGWRSDSLVSKLKHQSAGWIVTSDNIPHMDYPSIFFRFPGNIIATNHVKAIRKCHNLVCCSKFMKSEFEKHYKISRSIAIKNGIEISEIKNNENFENKRRDLIQAVTVGELIPRKNVLYLCKIFQTLRSGLVNLVIIGDGRERSKIARYESDEILPIGDQDHETVCRYMGGSDFFISASLSEGLPLAALEALSTGLPCLLSDIGPHLELKAEMPPGSVEIFSLSDPPDVVASKLPDYMENMMKMSNRKIRERATDLYSARKMSRRYQLLYSSILRSIDNQRIRKESE